MLSNTRYHGSLSLDARAQPCPDEAEHRLRLLRQSIARLYRRHSADTRVSSVIPQRAKRLGRQSGRGLEEEREGRGGKHR